MMDSPRERRILRKLLVAGTGIGIFGYAQNPLRLFDLHTRKAAD